MIKRINQQNLLTTPFVAVKDWSLYNIQNDDLVLTEQTGSTYGEEIDVAMDYLDYYGSNPVLNRDCNIALEQQSPDQVNYQEGEKNSGAFYSVSESQNRDGTYKRLIYSQLKSTFYNTYQNPTQLFGMEHIDFQLSKTQRYISDFFRMFNVPQSIFGDKLEEGTIVFSDNSLDDVVSINDDSYGNLVASNNLFSKIQELRHIGNSYASGSVIHICPLPITEVPDPPPSLLTGSLTASYSGGIAIEPYTVNLNWVDNSITEDGFYIWRSLKTSNTGSWSLFSNIASVGANVTDYQDIVATSLASASYKVNGFNYVGETSFTNTIMATGSNI
jgi:hypothetical protein